MRKLPPLGALKVFEAAARHLHFGKAAEELCVTAGAVSHQMRALEEQLGVTLFEKRGRQLHLTDAGQRLMRPLQQALDLMDEACADAVDPGMRGALRVSAPPELAHRFLTRIACDIAQRYPGLTLHLLIHDSDSTEIDPNCDVSIVYGVGDADWGRYWARPFRPIEFFPVCSPGLLQGEHRLAQPADLTRYPLLHDDQDGKTWATWLGAFAPAQLAVAGNLHFAHSGLAVEAALQGYGVALADVLTAGDELRSGRLIRPLPGSVPSPGNYYLATERRKLSEPRLTALLEWPALQPYLS